MLTTLWSYSAIARCVLLLPFLAFLSRVSVLPSYVPSLPVAHRPIHSELTVGFLFTPPITHHQEKVVIERPGGKVKVAVACHRCYRYEDRCRLWTALLLILFSVFSPLALANDASNAGSVIFLDQSGLDMGVDGVWASLGASTFISVCKNAILAFSPTFRPFFFPSRSHQGDRRTHQKTKETLSKQGPPIPPANITKNIYI